MNGDPEMYRGAVLSEDRVHRYVLWRRWAEHLPRMVFVMLNPSTADAEVDDRTIGRCVEFARREGCGGLAVVNLYSFRSTDPKNLPEVGRNGAEADAWIASQLVGRIGPVVVGWGAHGRGTIRATQVLRIIREAGHVPMCLGTTIKGAPRHPLYVHGDRPLEIYEEDDG